jgi:hypothetical protein
MESQIGTVSIAIVSAVILGFGYWIIHKITNL